MPATPKQISLGVFVAGKLYRKSDRQEALAYTVHVPKGGCARADVVFIHGIVGHEHSTWKHQGTGGFWPDWIGNELDVRVLTIDYPTAITTSLEANKAYSIGATAGQLHTALKNAGVGQRPVVFVCHSMGGLVLKKMLGDDLLRTDAAIWTNTAGVMFFATPHGGAKVPEFLCKLGPVLAPHLTEQIKGMKWNDEVLWDDQKSFVSNANKRHPQLPWFNFIEDEPLAGALVVDSLSAALGAPLDGDHTHRVQRDHRQICKFHHVPEAPDQIYGLAKTRIKKWLNEAKTPVTIETSTKLPVSGNPKRDDEVALKMPAATPDAPSETKERIGIPKKGPSYRRIGLAASVVVALMGAFPLFQYLPGQNPTEPQLGGLTENKQNGGSGDAQQTAQNNQVRDSQPTTLVNEADSDEPTGTCRVSSSLAELLGMRGTPTAADCDGWRLATLGRGVRTIGADRGEQQFSGSVITSHAVTLTFRSTDRGNHTNSVAPRGCKDFLDTFDLQVNEKDANTKATIWWRSGSECPTTTDQVKDLPEPSP